LGYFKALTGKIFAWNDGTQAVPRYDRAAMGDLDDYTGPNGINSPAQAGFRAIDHNGNAIFDSMGLINVALIAAQASSDLIIVGLSYSEQASAKFRAPRAGLTYLFLATATTTFTEVAAVPDSIVTTLTLDGNTAPNFSAPDYSPVLSQQIQGPVAGLLLNPVTAVWVTKINDVQPHRISLMVGKTGGTIVGVTYTLYAFQMGGS
jgi:hypothetical protein